MAGVTVLKLESSHICIVIRLLSMFWQRGNWGDGIVWSASSAPSGRSSSSSSTVTWSVIEWLVDMGGVEVVEALVEIGGSLLSFLRSSSFSHSSTTSFISKGSSFDSCFGPLIAMWSNGLSRSFFKRERNLLFCHFRTLAAFSGQALLTGQLEHTSAIKDSIR